MASRGCMASTLLFLHPTLRSLEFALRSRRCRREAIGKREHRSRQGPSHRRSASQEASTSHTGGPAENQRSSGRTPSGREQRRARHQLSDWNRRSGWNRRNGRKRWSSWHIWTGAPPPRRDENDAVVARRRHLGARDPRRVPRHRAHAVAVRARLRSATLLLPHGRHRALHDGLVGRRVRVERSARSGARHRVGHHAVGPGARGRRGAPALRIREVFSDVVVRRFRCGLGRPPPHRPVVLEPELTGAIQQSVSRSRSATAGWVQAPGDCRRSRRARSGLLRFGGARDRTALVVPDGPELHVVTVLPDTELALRARPHARLVSFSRDSTAYYTGPMTTAGADCLFCRIVARRSDAEIEYEDDHVLAFKDIYPKAAIHLLIVPKRHIASILTMEAGDAELIGRCLLAARTIGAAKGFGERGYRVSVNCGPEGGQHVYHVHFHFMAGGRRGA